MNNRKSYNRFIVIGVVLITAIFIGTSFVALSQAQQSTSGIVKPQNVQANAYSSAGTIFSDPNYTGGTYVQATVNNIQHLNIFDATSLYDFMLLDEIYDSLYNFFPNETYGPWLASSAQEYNVTNKSITTYDPLNGSTMPVNYIYLVKLRPGVQWDDWTAANASDTYVFTNYTAFNNATGVHYSHTYKKYYNVISGKNETWTNITMRTYYLQSADVILSWKILFDALDFSGEFQDVVNVVPVNNLTVEFYLSAQNALFISTALDTPILPYHIWVKHDWSSVPGFWNYTPSAPASSAYNSWDMNWNSVTGYAPGLVGTGPYMMYAGYGQPPGAWIYGDYWQLYVNPHYFAQYVPSLAQWAPRLYSIKTLVFTSNSAAVSALESGEVQSILEIPPTFVPTIQTIPHTYLYDKPGTGYGYQQVNSYPGNAPFNITTLRQALEYAIPKTYLASVVAEGYAIPGPSTTIPVSDFAWQDTNIPYYHFNMKKAAEMINETINETHGALSYSSTGLSYYSPGGTLYYKGKAVTISIQITVASEDPLGVEGADIIASNWDALGIHTTVKQEAFATLVGNLVSLTPSDQTSFSVINLGITGIAGNPAPDFITFNNQLGIGTGFYLGPYSNITYNGPNITNVYPGLKVGTTYNGTQVDQIMNNLTSMMFVETNVHYEHELSDAIQWIQAEEATFQNLGYTISIIPIDNGTFTGIIHDSDPIASFWYWNFMTLHLKTHVPVPIPITVPIKLNVGIISNKRIYYNGQFGNLTIQVRNQYGNPMPGIPVSIGYSPSGALVNITSYKGTTNAAGIYVFEFRVLPQNTLIYTKDYTGDITFTVSALPTSANEISGIGYAKIDVSPYPVAFEFTPLKTLTKGSRTYFNMTIVNAETGKPIPGYAYEIQAFDAALMLMNTSKNQTVQQVLSNYGGIAIKVNSTGYKVYDMNMTSISGVTGSNGEVSVMVQQNSSFNFTLNGGNFTTYLYLGDYASGAPMAGEAGYMDLGELTSSFNPSGFGVAQPFEVPVIITNQTIIPNISVTVMNQKTSYIGTSTIIINVTQSGKPVANYTVNLIAQNALGANRGYFLGGTGMGFNPNEYFGSSNMPIISVETNQTGIATATFNVSMYQPVYLNGNVVGYASMPYTSQYYIPFDEFIIGISGSDSSNVTDVQATQFIFNNTTHPFIVPVLSAYFANQTTVDNESFIISNTSYDLYINSTWNTPYGPYSPNIPFSVSVSAGTVSGTSGTTSSSGTFMLSYTAPNVTVITPVTITVTMNGGGYTKTFTYTFYVLPSFIHTITKTKTVTVTQKVVSVPSYAYAVIGVLAIISVAFIALYAIGRRKP
ncbi:MAG: ABC transporter substrate-binding protein [Thermoplasma acidophilum]|nr:ABC transporter substrate-binding protein [Thermoplasma acidophilum]